MQQLETLLPFNNTYIHTHTHTTHMSDVCVCNLELGGSFSFLNFWDPLLLTAHETVQ